MQHWVVSVGRRILVHVAMGRRTCRALLPISCEKYEPALGFSPLPGATQLMQDVICIVFVRPLADAHGK